MIPVVFNLDGTLIDSLPNITDAANALLRGEGLPPLDRARVAGFVGLGEQVFVDRLIAATDLAPQDRDRLLARFIAIYEAETARTRLFPGVRAALDAIRGAGHPLALCTNKPGGPLAHTLKAAALERTFDVVVAGDTLPVRKPDPAPLRHILDRLNADAAIYVGDSETDAETARRAGLPFVLFTEGIRVAPVDEIPHDRIFSDFAELPGIVAGLGARRAA